MGMAASQCSLLFLTSRNNDINYQLQNLSGQKMSLTNDMQKLTKEYQTGLSQKVFKWSNNGGATYVDLSYSNLMQPGAFNNNTPYMLTDLKGKIVIDSKYKQYAEMISEDGNPGDWEAYRSEILSMLTGLNSQDIEDADSYYFAFLDNKNLLEEITDSEPSKNSFKVQNKNSTKQLLAKLGSGAGINDWASAYTSSDNKVKNSDFENTIDFLKNNLGKYFLNDKTKFEKACDSVKETITETNYPKNKLTVKELVDMIIGAYRTQGGEFGDDKYQDENGNTTPVWYDIDSSAYTNYQEKYAQWLQQKNDAEEAYETSLKSYNQLFTAEQQSLIDFYDELFSSIADNGWTYNNKITDNDYLNQMLQNGMYRMTTVDRELIQQGNNYKFENEYNTDIASNNSKIYAVNDANVNQDALIKYEAEKTIIQKKENRIDTRMKNLETELEANKTRIETIKQFINNNIQRHMQGFSANA